MSIRQLPRCLNDIELQFTPEYAYLYIDFDPERRRQKIVLTFRLETLRKHPDNRPLEKLVYATMTGPMVGPRYSYKLGDGSSILADPYELFIRLMSYSLIMTVNISMCQELANALLDIQDRADRL